ncbi:MAG: hypothetical protein ACUVXA_04645 [Candidatus Jordarchaeum sp.]|uniref:hypothetical protein n=1 Tax=Candidatus Jordarchaeum sp. TaxID=2823881 RepID=UPI00404B6EFC
MGKFRTTVTLIGGLFAVISTIVGTVSILGAVVTYTVFPFRPLSFMWLPFPIPVINTGYNFWYQYVSEMSAGPSAFLYNVGVIITGILAIPVFPSMLRLLRSTAIAKIGIVSGVIASIAMSFSSVFPLYVNSAGHGISAGIFFASIGIAIVLLSYAMYRGTYFSKVNIAIGIIFVIVDLSFMFTGNPVAEWAVFFVIVLWLLAVGIHMIIKRNVTEV